MELQTLHSTGQSSTVSPECQVLNEILLELKHNNRQQKEVLGFQEAAEYLGIAPGTLYKLTSKGQIPFSKPGKRLIFQRPVLNQWLSDLTKSKQSNL